MIYKFKSKAAGDVIMMAPTAERVLAAIGKEASAKGIIEPAVMPAAIAALERAIANDEAARSGGGGGGGDAAADEATSGSGDAMPLRRRAWPMIEMLRRSGDAGEPIVWGV
jgi:Domain of unknown function (DUF1840)